VRFFSRYSIALLALILAGGFVLSSGFRLAAAAQSAAASQSPVERGKYLATVQDCSGCHTPFSKGEPDMTRLLSGHPQAIKVGGPPKLPIEGIWATAVTDTNTAWAGPWGVSFSTNLTPDRSTGIGAWTEDMFVSTIRNGKHLGTGRDLLPPMPWRMYANLTDADLRAVFAYLKSIPAITNRVPAPLRPAGAK
jgi:hypothetical protein